MENYEKKSKLIIEHIQSLSRSKQKEEIINLLNSIRNDTAYDKQFYTELEIILDDTFPEYTILKGKVTNNGTRN